MTPTPPPNNRPKNRSHNHIADATTEKTPVGFTLVKQENGTRYLHIIIQADPAMPETTAEEETALVEQLDAAFQPHTDPDGTDTEQ